MHLSEAAWQGRAHKLGPDHFRTLASAKRLLPLLQVSFGSLERVERNVNLVTLSGERIRLLIPCCITFGI